MATVTTGVVATPRRRGRRLLRREAIAFYLFASPWLIGLIVLEIGIPFSDPLLDGPVIQRSQQAALDLGVTPRDCLEFARQIDRIIQRLVGMLAKV